MEGVRAHMMGVGLRGIWWIPGIKLISTILEGS
jgi:hypothetical protein